MAAQAEDSASSSHLDDESSIAATIELPEEVALPSNDNKKTASDGKLIETEKIKEGTVDFTTSLAYIRAA